MRARQFVLALAATASLAGCQTIGKALSPFPPPKCDQEVEGKCQSVETTYKQSIEKTSGGRNADTPPPSPLAKKEAKKNGSWWSSGEDEKEKLVAAAQRPPKPLVKQGEVLRWRFVSYKTKSGLLIGPHDVWVIVKQPEFNVGTFVTSEK